MLFVLAVGKDGDDDDDDDDDEICDIFDDDGCCHDGGCHDGGCYDDGCQCTNRGSNDTAIKLDLVKSAAEHQSYCRVGEHRELCHELKKNK